MNARWICLCLSVLPLGGFALGDEKGKRIEPAKKTEARSFEVPYRLTDVKHILVRAKINGKGPFNFILDTGAPALFVSTAVCKKLGIEPDKRGWGTFDKFEIEGGVKLTKAKGRIEDPFQLEGMNSMGLAGAELHGVIGYNVLARFRLEFDFTKDKMTWTPLDFEPKAPLGMGGKAGGENEMMAGLLKLMAAFLGKKPMPVLTPRGFLGFEVADSDKGLTIKSVLPDSPAAQGGLNSRDLITQINGKEIKTTVDLSKRLAELKGNQSVKIIVRRGDDTKEITVKSGEGL